MHPPPPDATQMDARSPVNRQKRVKTLLCSILRLRAVIILVFCIGRFQACPHIVKFYGVTKALGQLFQLVEPLTCSLRHLLSNASENGPDVSDKSRFNFLKIKMVEVVKGMEYLHSRGWVHYDLSLDTVAVSIKQLFNLAVKIPQQVVKTLNFVMFDRTTL